MQLFLHVIFSNEPIPFSSEIRGWLKGQLPEVTYFDLDQRSEDLVIKTAIEAIDQSQATIIFIEGDCDNPQQIFKIIKRLQKKVGKQPAKVVNASPNQLISRLKKAFGSNWEHVQKEMEVKSLALDFFKTPA